MVVTDESDSFGLLADGRIVNVDLANAEWETISGLEVAQLLGCRQGRVTQTMDRLCPYGRIMFEATVEPTLEAASHVR